MYSVKNMHVIPSAVQVPAQGCGTCAELVCQPPDVPLRRDWSSSSGPVQQLGLKFWPSQHLAGLRGDLTKNE